ncbi:MAG: phytoene desaturase family protein [Patescibacteria group bacterium]
MKKQVIVMGAGIGGLSAAGQLAHAGYEVTVVEKHSQAGGKVIQFKKGKFVFDGGASFITLTEVYRDWFTSVGKDIANYIGLEKMKDTTTFYFHNGKAFTLSTNETRVRAEIAEKFPGNEEGFDRFMKIAADCYQLLYHGPRYARRNYHKLGGFDFAFNPAAPFHALKLQLGKTWKQIVDECFTAPELRAVFSYQATFLGMQPSKAMGTYCFFPWAEIHDGMFQVEGGVYGIIKGFEKACLELGVKFVYEAEITELLNEGDRMTGVKICNSAPHNTGTAPHSGSRSSSTEGSSVRTIPATTLKADIFVSNIDGAWFYSNLMPPEKNTHYTPEKLKQMKHTNSYFTINVGLKKPVKNYSHHTFFVARKWEQYFEKILQPGKVPGLSFDDTCYYFLQKSATHPWMAPKGKTSAFILVPVCGYDPDMNWNEYQDTFKNFIYDMMEHRDGIPIRDLIEEEEVYSPARWGQEFNLWENVILSFSLNFFQVNGFRMPNKSREFKNLYFSGSSTIPGPGLPPCITSGELVRERIEEDDSV